MGPFGSTCCKFYVFSDALLLISRYKVYTSYDYDASIRETREVRDKYKQYKLISLFTRVSKGLHNTMMESNGTGNAVSTTAVFTWVLKSKDSNGRFYLTEKNDTRSRNVIDFALTVNTSIGTLVARTA